MLFIQRAQFVLFVHGFSWWNKELWIDSASGVNEEMFNFS